MIKDISLTRTVRPLMKFGKYISKIIVEKCDGEPIVMAYTRKPLINLYSIELSEGYSCDFYSEDDSINYSKIAKNLDEMFEELYVYDDTVFYTMEEYEGKIKEED